MGKTALIRKWVGHKLGKQIECQLSKLAKAKSVSEIAVMPDIHIAGDVCNGVVVVTDRYLYPQCVGGDIGCGYLAVKLIPHSIQSASVAFDKTIATEVLSRLRQAVPVNKRREKIAYPNDGSLSHPRLEKAMNREGSLQLGTLGRGNHFVEIQLDQEGHYWLLIHSGSRAMGQLISAHHIQAAEQDSGSGLAHLDASSTAGASFLNDLIWARRYAAKNRLAMLDSIAERVLPSIGLRVEASSMIHMDHNHVQREKFIDGAEYWVHRKGAQRLLEGVQTVVPGSMGGTTFVVEGRGNRQSLNSCSHGAGRAMSRKEASAKLSVKSLRQKMGGIWFEEKYAKNLLDESPNAYKDIRKVMKAQKDLVRIVGQRQPVLNFKGR